jgi:hypothetical protein
LERQADALVCENEEMRQSEESEKQSEMSAVEKEGAIQQFSGA